MGVGKKAGGQVLGDHEIDALSESVLTGLLAGSHGVGAAVGELVAELARRDPDAPALVAVLPLALAANAIEGMLADGPARQRAAELWRATAMLSAEMLDLQSLTPGAAAPSIAALAARLRSEGAMRFP